MKKIICIVILLAGITGARYACAQINPNEVFDIPEEKLKYKFNVALDRGNQMEVSVTAMWNLSYISNIDSILKVFNQELSKIKDSLLPATMPRRIDYNMDVSNIKKLRLRKSIPGGSYYAFINGAPALLKLQQDTIVLFGRIPADWLRKQRVNKKENIGRYYFRVSFYLDDINDLAGYKDGRLNEKMRIIRQHYKGNWEYTDDERLRLKRYPEITSATHQGYIFQPQHFWFTKAIQVQNYKNYFIPSVYFKSSFVNEGDFVKREIGLSAELAFSFEKPANAAIKTQVNVFVGIDYRVTPVIRRQWAKIYPYVDLAYLVRRTGTVFDAHSFRLGLGTWSFGPTTDIQPAIYFHDLFKNTTPSLRIIQRF